MLSLHLTVIARRSAKWWSPRELLVSLNVKSLSFIGCFVPWCPTTASLCSGLGPPVEVVSGMLLALASSGGAEQ